MFSTPIPNEAFQLATQYNLGEPIRFYCRGKRPHLKLLGWATAITYLCHDQLIRSRDVPIKGYHPLFPLCSRALIVDDKSPWSSFKAVDLIFIGRQSFFQQPLFPSQEGSMSRSCCPGKQAPARDTMKIDRFLLCFCTHRSV
jgi:hypothetical protein